MLALPHYVVVAFFVGGGAYAGAQEGGWFYGLAGGLIGILVLVAGVIMLFAGRYPTDLFDLVLGLDRWVVRVVAYVSLMTDAYPPFRLNLGGREPPVDAVPDATPTKAAPQSRTWSAGRVVTAVVASTLLLIGAAGAVGGSGLLWADQTQRDASGFVTSDRTHLSTSAAAARYDGVDMNGHLSWMVDIRGIGTIRVDITSDSDRPVFLGVASSNDMNDHMGPMVRPGSGSMVVMNGDGSLGIEADLRVAATVPALHSVAVWVVVSSVGLVLIATLGMYAVPAVGPVLSR